MKYAVASFFALAFSFPSLAQKGKEYFLIDSLNYDSLSPADRSALDSLLPIYHRANHDTSRLKILAIIPELTNDENVWPRYNRLLFVRAKRFLNNSASLNEKEIQAAKKYLGQAYQNLGYQAQFLGGNMKLARTYYDSALAFQEQGADKSGMATTLQNIGLIYNEQGDVITALEFFFKSLKIQEEIQDKSGMGYSLNNIAGAYLSQGDTSKAMDYMERSMNYRQETGDKRGYAISLSNVANLYLRKNRFDEALSYYQKTLDLWKELGERQGIGFAHHNIGMMYQFKAQREKAQAADSLYALAMKNLEEGIRLYELSGFKQGLSMALASMGTCYLNKNDLLSAEKYGKRAFEEANKIGYTEAIRNSSRLLYLVYKSRNQWEEAVRMHETYISMRDSMFNQETQKSTFKQQAKYEFEKKQLLKDAEHKKELALAEEDKKRQQFITYSIALGLLMVAAFSIFIFSRLRITRRQKKIIEEQKKIVDEKNKHITESIHYAKRIQDAILPVSGEFAKHFKEHFVFFRPRDIVSGDFYWIHELDGKIIVACADCTGHGVPGAFMSMIGNALLNEIVNEKHVKEPSEILHRLNEGIVNALHQHSDSAQDDGMDIALCAFDLQNGTVDFSGANRSCLIVQNNELTEQEGDIFSIGGTFGKKDFSFSQKKIRLEKNACIYLCTDGYADQPGGDKRKKFQVKNFHDLLLKIHQHPMAQQQQIVADTMAEWAKTAPQLDDMLVMGIRRSYTHAT